MPAAAQREIKETKDERSRALGVAVEASYTVGEYDIVILSARESDGLETWLLENGYRIPKGASKALRPYIRQDMKFFVAKVNIKEQARTGLTYLRPLQFAYESAKFMLPLRLGMVNADGPQDLIAYVLTRKGRVEATNYRTIKVPANMDLPIYVRGDFAGFYHAMFERQAKAQDQRVVFTEYVWDMSWCDPCAAEPLSPDELHAAGVFWLDGEVQADNGAAPGGGPSARWKRSAAGAPVMVTRLHVRYTPQTFPEDLMFQETADRENFQARYVLRHPWRGRARRVPGGEAVPRRPRTPPGEGCGDAVLADRVGHQRRSRPHGSQAGGAAGVVGAVVEVSQPCHCRGTPASTRLRSWQRCSPSAYGCATSVCAPNNGF